MPVTVNDVHSLLNPTDVESVVRPRLAWAREDFGCVIFNIRTRHTTEGIAHTAEVFRHLYDAALDLGGSFFLTYQRAATREQVERAYPQFPDFVRLKRQYDPELRFQSEWWRHYSPMFE